MPMFECWFVTSKFQLEIFDAKRALESGRTCKARVSIFKSIFLANIRRTSSSEPGYSIEFRQVTFESFERKWNCPTRLAHWISSWSLGHAIATYEVDNVMLLSCIVTGVEREREICHWLRRVFVILTNIIRTFPLLWISKIHKHTNCILTNRSDPDRTCWTGRALSYNRA